MSYEPYTWKGGDTATANKLNHIEQGIAQGGSGGILYIPNSTIDNQTGIITLGMTAGEIFTALQENKFVFSSISMGEQEEGFNSVLNLIILGCMYVDNQGYAFPSLLSRMEVQSINFTCDYADEYPARSISGSFPGPGSDPGSGGIK